MARSTDFVAEPCRAISSLHRPSRLARFGVILERHVDFDAWRQDQNAVGQQEPRIRLKPAKRVRRKGKDLRRSRTTAGASPLNADHRLYRSGPSVGVAAMHADSGIKKEIRDRLCKRNWFSASRSRLNECFHLCFAF